MSLHIECSLLEPSMGVLKGGSLVASQTLDTAGAVSNSLVPNDGRPYVLRLVAEVKMYVSISTAEPNAAADPRRLLAANEELLISAVPGMRAVWVAKT